MDPEHVAVFGLLCGLAGLWFGFRLATYGERV
jgi:hypothetical protein